MILVDPKCQSLAKLAATETARYSMMGLRVTELPEGKGYRIEATDGRRGAIVDCPNVAPPADYPAIPALATAPNGQTSATIPADELVAALKSAPKKGPPVIEGSGWHRKNARAPLPTKTPAVAIVMGEKVSTLASTDRPDPSAGTVRTVAHVEGRYPDLPGVFPVPGQKGCAVLARVSVNAAYLAELLTVAAHFSFDDTNRVTLELYGPPSASGTVVYPIVVRAESDAGDFRGLLMPLS